jgi:tetratricopeptide (TPR) repeat protein
MISWIATRLFYAIVFFLLGAWLVTESPRFRAVMRHASEIGAVSFNKMRDWTSDTLLKTPDFTNTNATQSSASETAQPPSAIAGQPQTAAAPQAPAAPATVAQSANSSQQASAAATPEPAAAPAPGANGAADLLNRARQAYARKDFDAAIDAYRAFIEQSPGAIGAIGELGDVYYAAGRKHDAAQMYFECATKYLDAGKIANAKALVGAVREGDPEMADDLARRVAAAADKKS